MFLLPFKKKKVEPKKVYIPVDLVLTYASQGLDETQIRSQLLSQGFAVGIVDRAIRTALKEKINSQLPRPTAPPQQPARMPQPRQPQVARHPAPLGYPPERVVPFDQPRQPTPIPVEEAAKPFTFEPTAQKLPESPIGEITIEEIIEGVIDERWREFQEKLIEFERKDMRLEAQIEDLRKSFKEISTELKQKEVGLVSKLDDFGGSVENIEGRIGSIERVFKDFLPELTQNIKNMSDLVDKIKTQNKEK